MYTVLLPPGVDSNAVNQYIISSISTIWFDIKQVHCFLKLCTFEFHVILKTISTIYWNIMNQLVFVINMECALCEAYTEVL